MIVEISSHGSTIKRDHDLFIIYNSADNEKIEISAEKIDAIFISANAMISTQAINLCIEKNIQLVISDNRGQPLARLWTSSPGRATEIRRQQYLSQGTVLALAISKDILSIKLKRQRQLLLYLKNNRKEKTPILILNAILTIKLAIKKIGEKPINTTDLKSTLLGLEGSAAVQYFRALSSVLSKKWQFGERTQHPALDGFNACLNYIYGIGYSSVEKIIILSGLDPNAGFYHSDSYAKPTLSFDIIEIARPLLDKTIISLFTKRSVKEYWFEKQDDERNGIFVTKEGRQKLISSYRANNQKQIESETWNYCKKIIHLFESDRK
jgi:CRISP-associated protein Cas1